MRTYQQISPPRRSLLRHLCRLRTALVLLSLGMAFSSAHAQSACTVGYTIANQWAGGFQAALTIGNTGTTAVSNWTLTWSFANGQTVTQLWNGTETQTGANVSVTNAAFNGSIPAGGSVTGIGFTAAWNNVTNSVPTAFTLNGVACNGSSTGGTGGTGGGNPPPPALQIAWVSPGSGVAGSSITIMPGVGNSFGGSQGTSTVLFGSTRATVTTWTVNSVTVTVPNVPPGQVNVTAVVNGVTSNAVPFTVTSATPSPVVFTGNSTWFTALGSPYGGCGVPQANLDSQNFIALNVQNDPGNYPLQLSRPISQQFA
ncbi:MAG TPA: cellulose binding domain-containing protein, partial [Steroidobacteraceae bacterium]